MFDTRPSAAGGFTLIELMVVIGIVCVVAALAVPTWNVAQERTRSAVCLSRLKALGLGNQLYAQDHDGELPRSYHSSGAHREPGWAVSIAPYLGAATASSPEEWARVFERLFRCPCDDSSDPSLYSYGLNVFFELDPDGDDYAGSPATWRRISQIPIASRTILLAEILPTPYADHFMCHQWSGTAAARNAVDSTRHSGTSNYLFVDGHTERLAVEKTFAPENQLNLWNPSTASK